MSEARALRCDRCYALALRKPDGALADGWSVVRLQRGEPFHDTGHLDLCSDCTETTIARLRRLVTPPRAGEE